MAHQLTRNEVDALAASAAAPIIAEAEATAAAVPPAETTLAYGASGECVTKLVDLLAVLGYATNNVIKGAAPELDASVLADVQAAQTALGASEPEVTLPADIPVGVKGTLVGQATWNALYTAAEAKLAPPALAPATSDASAPAASDASGSGAASA